MARTDVHKPSGINPADYEYVGQECIKIEGIGDCYYVQVMRKRITEHMKKTGGTYSKHMHGGNCMVCGNVKAIYTVLFYHAKSNTYIRFGSNCAEKLEMSYSEENAFRNAVDNARKAIAGKKKAYALLADNDYLSAWYLYITPQVEVHDKYEENTIRDMVGKLVKYGYLSDRQWPYLGKLLKQISNRAEVEAKRAQERESALDCPSGRVTITGEVMKVSFIENAYGARDVVTVKDTRGFLVWGTLPRFLSDAKRGDTVTFKATVTPSDKDAKFGFYKRPTKK